MAKYLVVVSEDDGEVTGRIIEARSATEAAEAYPGDVDRYAVWTLRGVTARTYRKMVEMVTRIEATNLDSW